MNKTYYFAIRSLGKYYNPAEIIDVFFNDYFNVSQIRLNPYFDKKLSKIRTLKTKKSFA